MFKRAIEELAAGREVQIRPHGRSMTGRINDGELVTLAPVKSDDIKVDDAVLVKVKGNVYLHLVKAMDGDRVLIGNNRGGVNGWTGKDKVMGKCVRVEP